MWRSNCHKLACHICYAGTFTVNDCLMSPQTSQKEADCRRGAARLRELPRPGPPASATLRPRNHGALSRALPSAPVPVQLRGQQLRALLILLLHLLSWKGQTHRYSQALPPALRIPLRGTDEGAVLFPRPPQKPRTGQAHTRKRASVASRHGRGEGRPDWNSRGSQSAKRNSVPEEHPEASPTIHQAGPNAFAERLPEPHRQAAAPRDCVRGAEVLAPEESAAEVLAELRRTSERDEPDLSSPAPL